MSGSVANNYEDPPTRLPETSTETSTASPSPPPIPSISEIMNLLWPNSPSPPSSSNVPFMTSTTLPSMSKAPSGGIPPSSPSGLVGDTQTPTSVSANSTYQRPLIWIAVDHFHSPSTSSGSSASSPPASSSSSSPSSSQHAAAPTSSSPSSAPTEMPASRALLLWLVRHIQPAAFSWLTSQRFLALPRSAAENIQMVREAALRCGGIAPEDVDGFVERAFKGARALEADLRSV